MSNINGSLAGEEATFVVPVVFLFWWLGMDQQEYESQSKRFIL